jgi:hypothetical protein|tara:strand:+ start:487 stop:1092 length:606 start_codon:yes stop_codon:yes gene_type:complete
MRIPITLLSWLVIVSIFCAFFAIPPGAEAACPNKTINCSHGAYGYQGTCWREVDKVLGLPVYGCKACGKRHCPKVRSWEELPHVVRNKCMKFTVRDRIDGCSNPMPDKVSKKYKSLFKGACDAHDICYNSNTKKTGCDKNFNKNMKYICNDYYKGGGNAVMLTSCLTEAASWYSAVVVDVTRDSAQGYRDDQDWADRHQCK